MRLTLPRLYMFAFRPTLPRSAPKYPRPRPGTAERPPYRAPDPLLNNPKTTVTQLGGKDGEGLTFIHRPPPSAPTPYSLSVAPASPLLRPRILATTETDTAHSQSSSSSLLPPPIRSRTEKEEHPRMSDEDLGRVKYLRRSDPLLYTRGRLAKMFGCSPTFVGMVAPLKKSQCRALHKVLEEKHEKAKEKWSEKHQLVMEIRKKRKDLW